MSARGRLLGVLRGVGIAFLLGVGLAFLAFIVLAALLQSGIVRAATIAGPWTMGNGSYVGSAYITVSGSPAESTGSLAVLTLGAGSTASAGAVLTVGCSGAWYTVHTFASGGDAAGTYSLAWPVNGSACQPGVSTGTITVAGTSTWLVDDGVSPTPSPTPSPSGTPVPVTIGAFAGTAADDLHALTFTVLVSGGLTLFALGAVAMSLWRR